MKPRPLAVRPEELRAIRRAFCRVLPSVLVGDGSEGRGSVPEGRRSELMPCREALLLPSPPPTGATLRGRPPRGGHPNTTSSGHWYLHRVRIIGVCLTTAFRRQAPATALSPVGPRTSLARPGYRRRAAPLPGTAQAFASTQAAWRFYANPRVTLPQLAQPLIEAARVAVEQDNQHYALVVHDWSQLLFKAHHSKRDRAVLSQRHRPRL